MTRSDSVMRIKMVGISRIRQPLQLQPQVFINFRGEEIRYGFLSHLTAAFELHGIDFFIDKDELKGEDLKHLFKRIEESQIALVIFSKRYAQSRWCLNELAKMKELAENNNNLKVVPIFYKVKVDDVRRQKGKFGHYFWKLAKDSSGEEIKNWKEALEFVSYKMGLTLCRRSSEAEFVKEIVDELERVRSRIPIEAMEDQVLHISSIDSNGNVGKNPGTRHCLDGATLACGNLMSLNIRVRKIKKN